MKRVSVLKRTWNLSVVLQIVQKIPENYYPSLYLSVDQVWWLSEFWFKRCIQKCIISYAIIIIMGSEIWQIMG